MPSRSSSRVLSILSFAAALACQAHARGQPTAPAIPDAPSQLTAPPPTSSAIPPPGAPVAAAPASPPPSPAAPGPVAAPPATPPAAPALVLGELTLKPMLQARFRYEGRVNPYGNGVDLANANFVTTRVRIGLDARFRSIRVLAQLQDARNFGTVPGTDDGSSFGLHQGFLELGNGTSFARIGRQEIAYGDERMIGPLDWLMAARSFDGVRLHHKTGKLDLDAFGAMVRPQATYTIPNTSGGPSTTVSSRGDYLGTLYATYTASPAFLVDGYVLYRHDGPTDKAPTRDRDIAAPGVRVNGTFLRSFGYTAEVTFETGRVAQTIPPAMQGGPSTVRKENFTAYAASADFRYSPASSLRPLLGAGFATGSGARQDRRIDGFDNFYPTNHKFYGYADLFNLQNIVDTHIVASLRPQRIPATFQVQAFYFRQQLAASQSTNAGGNPIGQNTTGRSKSLGAEVDFTATYTPIPRLNIQGGYSVFVPMAAAERLGHDETQHWFFVQIGVDTP